MPTEALFRIASYLSRVWCSATALLTGGDSGREVCPAFPKVVLMLLVLYVADDADAARCRQARDNVKRVNATAAWSAGRKWRKSGQRAVNSYAAPDSETGAVAGFVVRDGMASTAGETKSPGFGTSRKEPNVCAYTHVNSAPIKKICAE